MKIVGLFFSIALAGCSSSAIEVVDAAMDSSSIEDGSLSPGADAAIDTSAIVAPADTWTWVDFPQSRCASGSATGIGVNLHPGATEILVYFEGGGSCVSAETCWGPSPSAANLSAFDSTTFSSTAETPQRNYAIFDRSNGSNPFATSSFVFIPYCTGDLHAGTTLATFTVDGSPKPTYFYGARDVEIFLQRLVPSFVAPKKITVAGTSAGGFASFLLWDQFAKAWSGVPIDILDDSGPAIAAKGQTTNAGLIQVWGYVAPTGCAAPCNSFADVLAYDRATQPSSRYGFLTFAEDTTISARFGYSLTQYATLMNEYSQSLSSDPAAATYIVTNEQAHVVESDPSLIPDFMPWIAQMSSGSSAWTDATFMHP